MGDYRFFAVKVILEKKLPRRKISTAGFDATMQQSAAELSKYLRVVRGCPAGNMHWNVRPGVGLTAHQVGLDFPDIETETIISFRLCIQDNNSKCLIYLEKPSSGTKFLIVIRDAVLIPRLRMCLTLCMALRC